MTNKEGIIDKVNQLLEDSGYPIEMKDMTDIEDFLNEADNQEMEEYDEIEQMYNVVMEESDYEDE